MSSSMPDLTKIQEAAVALHEMFQELQKAGFTQRQALMLRAEMLRAGQAQP